jgi:two-component system, sensor histidine kinase and response regulator
MSKVLVVDDEPALLDVVGDFVEMLGHEVVRAHDGEEALELVRTLRPSLVITDHMMPRRTGLALSREMRQDEDLSHIPIIIMSAIHPKGLDGTDVYIKKPFDLHQFEQLITKALDGKGTSDGEGKGRESSIPNLAAAASPFGDMRGDEVIGWVARSIRAPLTVAQDELWAILKHLESRGDSSATQRGRNALAALGGLDTLATSLLDAAQFAVGKVDVHLEYRDVGGFLERAVRSFRRRHPNASLIVKLPTDSLRAPFDEHWLTHVVDTILSNAERHGAVVQPIELTLQAGEEYVEIAITEHGGAFEGVDEASAFERPQRGADNFGHGLGLHVAAAIVKLHHGNIKVRSAKGGATTFAICLPRS